MKVGIVGHEAAKFTPATEAAARDTIRSLLEQPGVTHMVSGHCHIGGVDIWAEEEAAKLGVDTIIYPPRDLSWATGFKPRNIQIAHTSDIVHCVVVRELPPDYKGMRFSGCYHCLGRNPEHVKSGGCWTAWRAVRREWHIIG